MATDDIDTCGGGIDCLKEAVFWAGVVKDAYTVGKAIHTDCTQTENKFPGKGTMKAVISVAVGRAVGMVGSHIGEEIGHCLGAVGAQPGRAIGGLIGSFVGSHLAQKGVDKICPPDV